jgi:hypothetical protein
MAQLISLSVDSELPRAQRLAVKLHLLYCKACRRFRQQVLGLKSALAELSLGASPANLAQIPSLTPEARARIKTALGQGDTPRGQ